MLSGNREIEQGVRSLTLQADAALDAEFVRTLRVCDAAGVIEGALTFLPPTSDSTMDEWVEHWQAWLDGTFAELLAPTMLHVARHAHASEYREIVAADQALSVTLTAAATLRSGVAGRRVLKRLSAARGVRWLERLHAAAEAGSTPGQFATAYACQGALFHLSPPLVLGTYLYWEWCAAMVACRRPRDGAITAFQTATTPSLRRITEEVLSSTATVNEFSRAML